MNATAASTAMIHQRAGCPAVFSPLAAGPLEAAVFPPDRGAAPRLAGAVSAIALLMSATAGRCGCDASSRRGPFDTLALILVR
jgi:hypothetical protein